MRTPTKKDREFRKRLNELDGIDFDGFVALGAGISTEHFFSGIRCNGLQQHGTILGDLEEFKQTEEHIRMVLMPLHKKLKELIKDFPYRKCRSCKGKQGVKIGLNGWADCQNCDGVGFFWKDED